MKPDWKDAPEWAKWLAMDRNGLWHWYENEPQPSYGYWSQRGGRYDAVVTADEGWRESLESSP